ncbi:CTP synthase [Candidatus Peregrinibacteria bacterium]|nr:CTP synthase [Candidatus Peregrinibacteria bacterium]
MSPASSKFVFITGGVCSSLGKGIASASIGMLLKNAGFKVSIQKLDPYLNVDPGTMSPFQHGEVFVTDDGAETDLDLGHYERFIDENLSKYSTVTTGKVYSEVLEKERKGDFLGGTIQVVPHITNAIIAKIEQAAEESKAEILIIEIGGTVGDIEGEPFLEALRQMRMEKGLSNVLSVHLTLLPYLAASGELKTKPTQLSVREMSRSGVQPDIILCRADKEIPPELLEKISKFCNVEREAVIPAPTVDTIYEVPLGLHKHGITQILEKKMKLRTVDPKLTEWRKMVDNIKNAKEEIKIALCGKYTDLDDAYLSVLEAIKSASFSLKKKPKIMWIDTERIEKNDTEEWKNLKECAGIVVPGGFGKRGTEGKVLVAKYAREHKIPYLGLCLGAQIMGIEFARNVCHIEDATSEEFNTRAKNHIIHFLPGQSETRAKGGTLRLGAWPCVLRKGLKAERAYKKREISERHRHRYEFNNAYREVLEKNGFLVSGISPDGELVEIVEIKDHPFMLGTQFHPEFKSRPNRPHPLFAAFMRAVIS